MSKRNDWDDLVDYAIELQSIAQNGLAYAKDAFDKERFERVREISAEIISKKTDLPLSKVKDIFCNETGYQTPKLETRAVIFREGKILLIKENEKWALPGGWIDYNESVYSNTLKEAKEEAGLDVKPLKIIAIQDRNKHNKPRKAYGICIVFVLCSILGGSFKENNETTESRYFSLDELPVLDEDKTTWKQIEMCFSAINSAKWEIQFD